MNEIYAVNYLTENKQYILEKKEEIEKILNDDNVEYRKFNDYKEASDWINHKIREMDERPLELYYNYKDLKNGRKEISIKNQYGIPMLKSTKLFKLNITKNETFITEENTDEHTAELIALFLAFKVALNCKNIRIIYINSELIFKYWLRKIHNKLEEKTRKLLYDCIMMYEEFKLNKGILVLKE